MFKRLFGLYVGIKNGCAGVIATFVFVIDVGTISARCNGK